MRAIDQRSCEERARAREREERGGKPGSPDIKPRAYTPLSWKNMEMPKLTTTYGIKVNQKRESMHELMSHHFKREHLENCHKKEEIVQKKKRSQLLQIKIR